MHSSVILPGFIKGFLCDATINCLAGILSLITTGVQTDPIIQRSWELVNHSEETTAEGAHERTAKRDVSD